MCCQPFITRSELLSEPLMIKEWRFSVYHVTLCDVQGGWGMPPEQQRACPAGASPASLAPKPNRYACVHISVCMCMQIPWRCCLLALPLYEVMSHGPSMEGRHVVLLKAGRTVLCVLV